MHFLCSFCFFVLYVCCVISQLKKNIMSFEEHLKEVKEGNKVILNSKVQKELDKIFKSDYYGSKEQIFNEKLMRTNSFVKDNCEMKYNETIEDWYLRIYDLTK